MYKIGLPFSLGNWEGEIQNKKQDILYMWIGMKQVTINTQIHGLIIGNPGSNYL